VLGAPSELHAQSSARVESSALVIATWQRPKLLQNALTGVRAQSRPFDEVLISVRPEDSASREVIATTQGLPIREILVNRPSAVAARNAAMDVATSDICAYLDDDAVPPPQWHADLVRHYEADPAIGAVGGRDRIYHDGELEVGERAHVGTVRPYGRFIGLHHLGAGEARDVDLLKGVNMSIRLRYFPRLRFDEHLRGNGAEPHEDWALSLAVRQAGFRVIYDPAIWVDHFEGERIGVNQRSDLTGRMVYNRAYNQTYAAVKYLPPSRAIAHVVYAVLVGSRNAPGVVSFSYRLIQREFGTAVSALNFALRGRFAGISCGWRSRRRASR
jgi:GT2 family glycosyltransferase